MRSNPIFSRVVRVLFWVALVVLGAGVFRNIEKAHAQSQRVDGSSVVLQEVLTKPDGSKMLSATYKFANRSDGSSVFVGAMNSSSVEAPVRMVRLASGLQGYISDAKQQKCMSAISVAGNPGLPANIRIPSSKCILGATNGREAAFGEEQVSGYQAEKIVMDNRTAWYALDFGCALLKEHFDWPDGQKSDKYLLLLRPGEPESSLFDVPSSYADVPRSAFR